jgi:hypothetical protein
MKATGFSKFLTIGFLGLVLFGAGCATGMRERVNPLALSWKDWEGAYAARASSWDPTGANMDSIRILPGQTATLADLGGAGIIRHIWITTNEAGPIGRTVVIRMYWDGSDVPAVEAPLGDFFGVGNGMEANVISWPITAVSRGRARNCWWPMPFANGAKITATNEGPTPHGAFYFHIDYLALEGPPPTEERFHARYHQEYPAESADRYRILETTGRGHFAGVVFSVESTKAQWWGEGDEWIEVDDHEPIRGTGTEDYFCDAWGMREHATLWHGTPVSEGYDAPGLRSSMYRFHIIDPIPFEDRISVSIEHGSENDRADNLSSVAFWYQTQPASGREKLPPPEDRVIGEDRAKLFRNEAWRAARSEAPGAEERLADLFRRARMEENRILIEGLQVYAKGLRNPSEAHLESLETSVKKLKKLVNDMPEDQRYLKPVTDFPTDDDAKVPSGPVRALETAERAMFDLARRVALARGFQPGDELVVESRDPQGGLTPPPAYEDTADFTDSYAKEPDPHTLGNGARFTYGNATPSWARFTPDFPVSGEYTVFTIFSYGANADDTRYEIRHAGGSAVVPLPQRGRPETSDRNNAEWISLGRYKFEAGQDWKKGSVALVASPGAENPNPKFEYRAYADAVRFVYQGPGEEKE